MGGAAIDPWCSRKDTTQKGCLAEGDFVRGLDCRLQTVVARMSGAGEAGLLLEDVWITNPGLS